MARLGDPESKYATSRARAIGRYADRVGPERAEELVDAWETDAEATGLARDARSYWGRADAWLQKRVRQMEREERGRGPGFEHISLDLDPVPSVEQGLEDAWARRKELSDALLASGLGGDEAPLFREHFAFSSFINRAVSLHDGVVSAVRDTNPHSAFTLLRAYNELLVIIHYVCDYPDYLDVLERPRSELPAGSIKEWREFFEHAAGEMAGIRAVYEMLSEMAHFGSTALWQPFRIEDEEEGHLSFGTAPHWRDSERDPRVALAMLREADITTIAVLQRFADRHIIPKVERHREVATIKAAATALGASPDDEARNLGTVPSEVAEELVRAGLLYICEEHDALETVAGVPAQRWTEFARAWNERNGREREPG